MVTDSPRLIIRLRSCLQTIFDLETELQSVQMAESLSEEFSTLKEIYERLETLLVREEDVCRIEDATAHFLREIKGSIKEKKITASDHRFLQ